MLASLITCTVLLYNSMCSNNVELLCGVSIVYLHMCMTVHVVCCSGTAYIHGIKHATGNFVIIMDADLSHHVSLGSYQVITLLAIHKIRN